MKSASTKRDHLAPLVGRNDLLARLRRAIEEAPLVLVHGSPGAGKSRLVAELEAGFDPVAWIDLSGAEELADLAVESCRALGIEASSGDDVEGALERIGAALRATEHELLVLDDFDRLAEAASRWLVQWANAAGAPIVVTCRRRLEFPGAQTLSVTPLSSEDAVRLFELHATQSQPDFELERHREGVEELVEALDRLPFAIELAARRVHVFTPQEMLRRLDRRFALLRRRGGGKSEAFDVALEWTWELLTDDERAFLGQFSVFTDSVELEAVESVVMPEDPLGTIDTLDELVAKSWIQSRPAPDGGGMRFRLLETVRAFVLRQVSETPNLQAPRKEARVRAAVYYTSLARRLADHLMGEEGPDALDRLDIEQRHLLWCADYWLERRDPRMTWVVAALGQYALLRGRLFHYKELVERACTAAEQHATVEQFVRLIDLGAQMALLEGDRHRAVERVQRALEVRSECSPQMQAAALRTAGVVESATSPGRAADYLDEALEWAEEADDDFLRARVLERRGYLRLRTFELIGAEEAFVQARELFEEGRFELFEADSLAGLAYIAHRQNRLEEAIEIFDRVVDVHRSNAARASAAGALFNLGTCYHIVGELEEAASHLREALAEWERLGMSFYRPVATARLGLVLFERGDVGSCEKELKEAFEEAERLGDPQTAAVASGLEVIVSWLTGEEVDPEALVGARAKLHAGSDPDAAAAFSVAALATSSGTSHGRLAELNRVEELVSLLSAQDTYLDEVLRRLLLLGRGFEACSRAEHAVDGPVRQEHAQEAARLLHEVVEPAGNVALMAAIARLKNPFVRLLAGRLASKLRTMGVAIGQKSAEANHVLEVHSNCHWYRVDGGQTVELSVRKAIRVILKAILQLHFDDRRAGLDIEQLIEIGWPDEDLTLESGRNRVYSAIRYLRNHGLDEVIETSPQGYRVAAGVEVRVAPTTGIRVS